MGISGGAQTAARNERFAFARRVTVYLVGLAALLALGFVVYLWASPPGNFFSRRADINIVGRSEPDAMSLWVVQGQWTSGQSFSNYRSISFLGVHLEAGSNSGAARYVSVSFPPPELVLLLAVPVLGWMLAMRRALANRRKATTAAFDVVPPGKTD